MLMASYEYMITLLYKDKLHQVKEAGTRSAVEGIEPDIGADESSIR